MKYLYAKENVENILNLVNGYKFSDINWNLIQKLDINNKLLTSYYSSISLSIGYEKYVVYCDSEYYKKGDIIESQISFKFHINSPLPFIHQEVDNYYLVEVNGVRKVLIGKLPPYISLIEKKDKLTVKDIISKLSFFNSISQSNSTPYYFNTAMLDFDTFEIKQSDSCEQSLSDILLSLEEDILFLYNVRIPFITLFYKLRTIKFKGEYITEGNKKELKKLIECYI
jgi:hypothetical protein